MRNKTTAKILRTVAFLLCVVILLTFLTNFCERKTYLEYWGSWNYMSKVNEFYALENNSLDYICVGSSHMYCTLNPLEIWDSTGTAGFILATQQQPLMASYYYIKEALKTQSPKVVVVEAWMGIAEDSHESAVLYDAIDPLKSSVNKLQMIRDLVPKGERKAYYLNLIKYHSRWQEILPSEIWAFVKSIFVKPKDTYKGFVALDGDHETVNLLPDYDAVETKQLSAYNAQILANMKEVIEASGAEMVLLFGPYGTQETDKIAAMKGMQHWAAENCVEVLDYAQMLDTLSIDPKEDYYDNSHLDVSGAAKISRHFADYLAEKGIADTPGVDAAKWQADLDTYRAEFHADLNP